MPPSRPRARDLGLRLGQLLPGPLNAITDVPGVRVGHASVIHGDDVRTGVTAILPHSGDPFLEKTPAAVFVLNGHGKACGLAQLEELGVLETPILLTNTLQVASVADVLVDWMLARNPDLQSVNPVVGECSDAFLNDIRGRHVRPQHVFAALDGAADGPVAEGAVGAGVGMSCFGFKGGIGTASRQVADTGVAVILGALVVANFGRREELRIDGIRVGEALPPAPEAPAPPSGGSIMVVLATDAPLETRQLGRIARRGPLGLGRTGSIAHNTSGDFFLAFSTAQRVPFRPSAPLLPPHARVADDHPLMDRLFQAAVESVEEAIVNALFGAETIVGKDGHVREALPIEPVVALLRQTGRLVG